MTKETKPPFLSTNRMSLNGHILVGMEHGLPRGKNRIFQYCLGMGSQFDQRYEQTMALLITLREEARNNPNVRRLQLKANALNRVRNYLHSMTTMEYGEQLGFTFQQVVNDLRYLSDQGEITSIEETMAVGESLLNRNAMASWEMDTQNENLRFANEINEGKKILDLIKQLLIVAQNNAMDDNIFLTPGQNTPFQGFSTPLNNYPPHTGG